MSCMSELCVNCQIVCGYPHGLGGGDDYMIDCLSKSLIARVLLMVGERGALACLLDKIFHAECLRVRVMIGLHSWWWSDGTKNANSALELAF